MSVEGRRRTVVVSVIVVAAMIGGVASLPAPVSAAGGSPPDVTTTAGSTNVSIGGGAVTVDSSLSATDDTDQQIDGARVIIDDPASGDRLTVDTSGTSVADDGFDSGSGVLKLSGTAPVSEYQQVLRTVEYEHTDSDPTRTSRSLTFSLGDALSSEDTGHYYEYVGTSKTWSNANSTASAKSYFGLQGYLATVTSADENQFIKDKLKGDAWMGASDDTAFAFISENASGYDRWYWVTGPERGTHFWTGDAEDGFSCSASACGDPIDGEYTNWGDNEPNDYDNTDGNENYAHFYADDGEWNDFPEADTNGYVVEYGGLSGDPAITWRDTKTVELVDTTAPSADASNSNTAGDEDTAISFDATASADAETSITTYEWDWTDDGTYDDTGQTPSHTYADPGTYTVELRVTDEGGNTANDTVTVTVADVTDPTADVSNSPSAGSENTSISFDGTASTDNGVISAYAWDWTGDGSYDDTGGTPSHTYGDPGSYTVTLRVTDADGNTDTDTTTVTVDSVSLSASNTTADTGETGSLAFDLTNSSGIAIPNAELNVTDAGGLGGLAAGDTVTTDSNGAATLSFQDATTGTYTVGVAWSNDTTINDTATVTVRAATGGSGSSSSAASPATVVTVEESGAGETGAAGGPSDRTAADREGDDATSDDTTPDMRVTVSNPDPGQTLIIDGDDAYVIDGEIDDRSDIDDGIGGGLTEALSGPIEGRDSVESGGDGRLGGDGGPGGEAAGESAAGDETQAAGESAAGDEGETADSDGSAASSSTTVTVRPDRLAVTVDTSRDFTVEITTYESDLTRSSTAGTRQSLGRPSVRFSGLSGALFDTRQRQPETEASAAVRQAADSFETETGYVSAGYVEISHDLAPEEIAGGSFAFSIRRDYLDELGVEPAAIDLYHQVGDGEWAVRETTAAGSDGGFHRFEGRVPDFSVFALGTSAPVIDVTALRVDDSTVGPGTPATVTATVENRGLNGGEYTATLHADGESVASRTVSVAGQDRRTVAFTFEAAESGSYDLAVGGERATLTVGPGRGVGGGPGGGLGEWSWIVGVVVVGILVVLVWSRRDDDQGEDVLQ